MPNVIAFTPRPRVTEPPVPPAVAIDLRAHLEDAAQTALDAAEKVMAALDHLESHDGAAPPLAATIAGHVETAGEGGFRYRYAPVPAQEPPADPAPIVAADPQPETVEQAPERVAEPEVQSEPVPLPWRGAGNVVAAAGCALLALVGAA